MMVCRKTLKRKLLPEPTNISVKDGPDVKYNETLQKERLELRELSKLPAEVFKSKCRLARKKVRHTSSLRELRVSSPTCFSTLS